nr:EAL domain-containing protein [Pseudomarimonas arenosa]
MLPAYRLLLLALAYYGCARLGLSLPLVTGYVTVLWLPSGIAVAALYRWGLGYWPAVYLAALAVEYKLSQDWGVSLGIAVSNTLAPLAAAWVLRRGQFSTTQPSARDLLVLLFGAALGCMLISASGGTLGLYLSGAVQAPQLSGTWLSWWLGDAVGVLAGGLPLLLLHRQDLHWSRYAERAPELLATVGFALIVGLLPLLSGVRTLAFDLLPLAGVIWLSLRFSLWPALALALALSLLQALEVSRIGPSLSAEAALAELIHLWTYVTTLFAVAMLVAGLNAERERSRQQLQESEQRYRSLIEHAPEAIVVLDPELGHFVEVNQEAERLFACSRARLLTLGPAELSPERQPDGRLSAEAARENIGRALGGEMPQFRWTHLDDQGRQFTCEVRLLCLPATDRRLIRGSLIDISEELQLEQLRQEQEDRLRLALEASGDGVWDWHIQKHREYYSPRLLAMYGYSSEDIEPSPDSFDRLTHPDDVAAMQADREAHWHGETDSYVNEHRIRCKDGSWKWVLSRGAVVSRDGDGSPLRMVGTHTDISARKEIEDRVWRQANFDGLTGLPNRHFLRRALERMVEEGIAVQGGLSLLFIDLDGFKEVNDTYGHDLGDQLLIEAARRIDSLISAPHQAARLGGDEFTVVLRGVVDIETVDSIATQLVAVLDQKFEFAGHEAFVSASIGISRLPQDAHSVSELFKHADQALYVAKDLGRNRYAHFSPELQRATEHKVRLGLELRTALAEQQFFLCYQPIVDLQQAKAQEVEALLRWRHPERGLISPNEFVPVAESAGLIAAIGDWVFRQGVRQLAHWRRSLDPDMRLSINKSPAQFRAPTSYLEEWLQLLASLRLPGAAVSIEITEGLLLERGSDVSSTLQRIRDVGLTISIDDFGTGYSSLAYLQEFAVDFLKIDRSFVRHLPDDPRTASLCRAIIVMAHELGFRVIAEGVETQAQALWLLRAGCDLAQGFYFGKAVPADEAPDVLRHLNQQLPQLLEAELGLSDVQR